MRTTRILWSATQFEKITLSEHRSVTVLAKITLLKVNGGLYALLITFGSNRQPCYNRSRSFIRLSGAFGKRRLELGKLDEELAMPFVGHPTSTVMYFGRVSLGAALCLAYPLLLESLLLCFCLN